jgi:hypothetical protein
MIRLGAFLDHIDDATLKCLDDMPEVVLYKAKNPQALCDDRRTGGDMQRRQ